MMPLGPRRQRSRAANSISVVIFWFLIALAAAAGVSLAT